MHLSLSLLLACWLLAFHSASAQVIQDTHNGFIHEVLFSMVFGHLTSRKVDSRNKLPNPGIHFFTSYQDYLMLTIKPILIDPLNNNLRGTLPLVEIETPNDDLHSSVAKEPLELIDHQTSR